MTYQRPSHLGTRAGIPLRWAASLTLCALSLVASAHPAQGAGVVGTGTPGSCTEAALDTALAGGGLVTFDCGPAPVTITITSSKTIAADTTIDGGGVVTISGGNSVGVFSVNTGVTFTVQNLTIANGRAHGGGAIANVGYGSTLTITNSTFSGNSADIGGAIYTLNTLTVTNSTFSGNSAGDGGGAILTGGSGTFSVINSTFSGNSGGYGGAINNHVSLSVTNSTFSGNSAPGDGFGGGIVNSGNLTVTNSTFSGNSAPDGVGGAIGNYSNYCVIYGSTFSHNSAAAAGAIFNNGNPPDSLKGIVYVTNSTFSRNSGGTIANGGTLGVLNSTFSGNMGSAIDNTTCGGDPCWATLRDTIVANSSGGNCAGTIINSQNNIDSDGTCGGGPATDPLLDPAGLSNNGGPTQTIALLAGSPAINAGSEGVCSRAPVSALDQRGYVRPGVGHTQCSIGAYEADAVPPPPCVGDCNGDGAVAINELILGVNIVLELRPVDACPTFANAEGMVDIAQLITGVNNALGGCGAG